MTVTENGFIALHRRLRSWRWYRDSKTVHLWIELLMRANHEPHAWMDMTIERGQCIVGLKSLNETTGISIQSIRTCLERLKSTGELTIKSTNKYSLVSIANYDSYQDVFKKSTRKSTSTSTNNQQTINKQLTTNNNKNNDNNDNKKNTPEKIEIAPRLFVNQDFEKQAKQEFNPYFVGRDDWFNWEIKKASNWTKNKGRIHKDCEAFLRNWFMTAAEEYAKSKPGQGRARKNYKEILK